MKVRRAWAVLMLISFLLGAGCTSLREIPPGEYAAGVPKKAVRVVTVDSLRYELDSASIVGDTLVGYRRKDVEGSIDEFFTVRVPLDRVQSISARRVDWYRTGLIAGLTVGAVVAAGLSRHSSNSGGNGLPCDPEKDPGCSGK